MDALEAIFKRRTAHLFEPKKVSERIIEDAIKAANQAPCHKLTFPWRFYLVSNQKRNEILDLAISIKSKDKKLDQKSKNIIKDKYKNPSNLLIASQILNEDKLIKKEDYAACACAIQNLSISLTTEGVSSKWSTGSITRDPKLYEITKINSLTEEIIGFIWIGFGRNSVNISRPLINEIYKAI